MMPEKEEEQGEKVWVGLLKLGVLPAGLALWFWFFAESTMIDTFELIGF